MLNKTTEMSISGTDQISSYQNTGSSVNIATDLSGLKRSDVSHQLSFARILMGENAEMRSPDSGTEVLKSRTAAGCSRTLSAQNKESCEVKRNCSEDVLPSLVDEDSPEISTMLMKPARLISAEQNDVPIDSVLYWNPDRHGSEASQEQARQLGDITFCGFGFLPINPKTEAGMIIEGPNSTSEDPVPSQDEYNSNRFNEHRLPGTLFNTPKTLLPFAIAEPGSPNKEVRTLLEVSDFGLNRAKKEKMPRTGKQPDTVQPRIDLHMAQQSAELKNRQTPSRPVEGFKSSGEIVPIHPPPQATAAVNLDAIRSSSGPMRLQLDQRYDQHSTDLDRIAQSILVAGDGSAKIGERENAAAEPTATLSSPRSLARDSHSARLHTSVEQQQNTNAVAKIKIYENAAIQKIGPVNSAMIPDQVRNDVIGNMDAVLFEEKIFDVHGNSGAPVQHTQGQSDSLSGMTTRPVLAKPGVQQLAEALIRTPDRPVEVSLNPEELGRVRMRMSIVETSVTVSILAERPESLDLIRRNIDQLAEEFRSLGYDMIGFDFGESHKRWSEEPARQAQDITEPVVHGDVASMDSQRPPLHRNGLDMRL